MRQSGILLHITSLPSPHGIGTLGRHAMAFADFLAKAGQSCWQILPLGPTEKWDSPYKTDTAFGGNPLLIDLELLAEDGLLTSAEISEFAPDGEESTLDTDSLRPGREELLRRAFHRGWERDRAAVSEFFEANRLWLRDYALYTAAKAHFGGGPWTEWPDEALRLRRSEAVLTQYEEKLREDVDFCIYTQYLFFRQWDALREYIRARGITLIGDVPIYVPMDSADVWAERRYFQLDGDGQPTAEAGVPPDYFSEDGQLWGNPLYDWERMAEDGYSWWLRRMGAASRLFDVVRIDHFRGLESYWAVPYGETTAKNGCWCKGPGEDFIAALKAAFPDTAFIAEDLGILTDEVRALRAFSGFPGMKVLQFAFDPAEESSYLPHNGTENSVCYTGTHDNATLAQWAEEAGEETVAFAREYLGLGETDDLPAAVIRAGMGTVSKLFITQMQDWLPAGECARMNTPGTTGGGNWCWRVKKEQLSSSLAEHIRHLTALYGRAPKEETE